MHFMSNNSGLISICYFFPIHNFICHTQSHQHHYLHGGGKERMTEMMMMNMTLLILRMSMVPSMFNMLRLPLKCLPTLLALMVTETG